jgi:hypothetical protein
MSMDRKDYSRTLPKVNFHKTSAVASENIAKHWEDTCQIHLNREPWPLQRNIVEAIRIAAATGQSVDDDEGNREIAEILHWHLSWRENGYPCFQLTHSLAAALLLTDCKEVKGRDLKFPFPSFLVTLPRPNGLIEFTDPDTDLPIEAGWIQFHSMQAPAEQKDGDKICAALRDRSYLTEDPDVQWRDSTIVRVIEPRGIGVFNRQYLPTGEETLEEWLTSYQPIGGKYQFESTDLDKSSVHASLRLLVNLSFYLDAQSAQGKKLPKRKILRRKWGRSRDDGPPIPPAWQLGQDVKLSAELREAAKHSASPNPKTRAEWELKSQHVVRGHWRNQAHGPERTLRKRIWITPHWRGPRASEAIVRNFSGDD